MPTLFWCKIQVQNVRWNVHETCVCMHFKLYRHQVWERFLFGRSHAVSLPVERYKYGMQDEKRGDDILIRGISKWKVHLSFSFTHWKHLRSCCVAWGFSELRLGCNCTEDERQLCLIHPAVIQWGGGPHMCLCVCLCVSDVIAGGSISQCGSSQRHSSELQYICVCVCSLRVVLAPCTAL